MKWIVHIPKCQQHICLSMARVEQVSFICIIKSANYIVGRTPKSFYAHTIYQLVCIVWLPQHTHTHLRVEWQKFRRQPATWAEWRNRKTYQTGCCSNTLHIVVSVFIWLVGRSVKVRKSSNITFIRKRLENASDDMTHTHTITIQLQVSRCLISLIEYHICIRRLNNPKRMNIWIELRPTMPMPIAHETYHSFSFLLCW